MDLQIFYVRSNASLFVFQSLQLPLPAPPSSVHQLGSLPDIFRAAVRAQQARRLLQNHHSVFK